MSFKILDYCIEKDIETIDKLNNTREGEKVISGVFKYNNKKGTFKVKFFWKADGTSGKDILITSTMGDKFSENECEKIIELIEENLEKQVIS